MKKILVFAAVLFVGCGPHKIENPNLPKGLIDCDVYATDYGTVIRCPEITTTHYMSGKVPVNNSVTNTKKAPNVVIDSTSGKITIEYGESQPF